MAETAHACSLQILERKMDSLSAKSKTSRALRFQGMLSILLLLWGMSLLFGGIATGGLLEITSNPLDGKSSASSLLVVFGGGMTLAGFGFSLLTYLGVDVGKIGPRSKYAEIGVEESTRHPSDPSRFSAIILAKITELESALLDLRHKRNNSAVNDASDVAKELLPLIQEDMLSHLERHYSDRVVDANALQKVRVAFDRSESRLKGEVLALGRRGNVNLVIGIVTTSVAICLLVYMVLVSNQSFADLTGLLAHYVPRVTVVAFIEVFSFFFLRLYRATLIEIKGYQDEITALAVKSVAFEVAWTDRGARGDFSRALIRDAAAKPLKDDSPAELGAISGMLEKLMVLIPKPTKAA